MKNTQVLFASRPDGAVQESNFRVITTDIPAAGDGEFVVRNHYLSLDPYMRGRMDATRSYAHSAKIGDVMIGTTVGEVIDSRHPKFPVGDFVETRTGWQCYGRSDGGGVRKIDPSYVPLTTYLGAVGMPGVTAWIGLNEHSVPKPGETVVVSAASGAVGSVAGQLAKFKGCRVVGIAGGKAKCDHVVNDLGLDACVDYKAGKLAAALDAACPRGIDVYFDNVGGPILDEVLLHMNDFSRIALCGRISGFDNPDALTIRNFGAFLTHRIALRGYICSDHMPLWKPALKELGELIHDGKLKYRESIAEGIENAPAAFIGLLKGKNFGKQLVKLI
jgi:NADPH-dependent curcumin reductase